MVPRNKRKRLLRGLQIKMKTNEDKKKTKTKVERTLLFYFAMNKATML